MIGTGLAITMTRGRPGPPPENAAPIITDVTFTPASGPVGTVHTATIVGTGWPNTGKTYVIERDGTPIPGATSRFYTSVEADIGADITCVGTWNNGVGSPASRESAAVTVTAAPIAPTVSGAAISPTSGNEGATFTASATITGAPSPTVEYEWLLDGSPVGADQNTHVPAGGGALRVTITATNAGGSASDTSAAATVSALAAPTNDTLPTTSGTAKVGSTLTRTLGSWSGNPTPGVAGNWQRDNVDIPGETGATYTLVAADNGATVRWQDTATNSEGSATANSAGLAISYAAPIAVGGDTWAEVESTGDQTFDASALFTVAGDLDLSSVTGFTFVLLPGGSVFADGVFESGVFESGGGSGYLTINEDTGLVTLDTNTSGLLSGVDFTVRCTNLSGSADATITLTVTDSAIPNDRFPYTLPITFSGKFPYTLPLTFRA